MTDTPPFYQANFDELEALLEAAKRKKHEQSKNGVVSADKTYETSRMQSRMESRSKSSKLDKVNLSRDEDRKRRGAPPEQGLPSEPSSQTDGGPAPHVSLACRANPLHSFAVSSRQMAEAPGRLNGIITSSYPKQPRVDSSFHSRIGPAAHSNQVARHRSLSPAVDPSTVARHRSSSPAVDHSNGTPIDMAVPAGTGSMHLPNQAKRGPLLTHVHAVSGSLALPPAGAGSGSLVLANPVVVESMAPAGATSVQRSGSLVLPNPVVVESTALAGATSVQRSGSLVLPNPAAVESIAPAVATSVQRSGSLVLPNPAAVESNVTAGATSVQRSGSWILPNPLAVEPIVPAGATSVRAPRQHSPSPNRTHSYTASVVQAASSRLHPSSNLASSGSPRLPSPVQEDVASAQLPSPHASPAVPVRSLLPSPHASPVVPVRSLRLPSPHASPAVPVRSLLPSPHASPAAPVRSLQAPPPQRAIPSWNEMPTTFLESRSPSPAVQPLHPRPVGNSISSSPYAASPSPVFVNKRSFGSCSRSVSPEAVVLRSSQAHRAQSPVSGYPRHTSPTPQGSPVLPRWSFAPGVSANASRRNPSPVYAAAGVDRHSSGYSFAQGVELKHDHAQRLAKQVSSGGISFNLHGNTQCLAAQVSAEDASKADKQRVTTDKANKWEVAV